MLFLCAQKPSKRAIYVNKNSSRLEIVMIDIALSGEKIVKTNKIKEAQSRQNVLVKYYVNKNSSKHCIESKNPSKRMVNVHNPPSRQNFGVISTASVRFCGASCCGGRNWRLNIHQPHYDAHSNLHSLRSDKNFTER